jgi:hypothetical protein
MTLGVGPERHTNGVKFHHVSPSPLVASRLGDRSRALASATVCSAQKSVCRRVGRCAPAGRPTGRDDTLSVVC